MVTIAVEPTPGWQWGDTAKLIEWDYVPDPFIAETTQKEEIWYEKPVTVWTGKVTHPSHPLDGHEVKMSQRHEQWDGHVNLMIVAPNGRTLSGFAVIDKASLRR